MTPMEDEEMAQGQMPAGESMPEMGAEEMPEAEMAEDDDNAGFGAPNVSQDEQRLYERIVLAGMQTIYGEGGIDGIAARLRESKDNLPAAIGQLTANVLLSVARKVKEQRGEADPEMLMQAGKELLAEIVEVAETIGALPPEQVDQVASQAAMEAVKAYGEAEMRAGEITDEDKAAAADYFKQQGVDVDRLMAQQGQGGQPMQQPAQEPQPRPSGGLSQMAGAMR